MNKFRATAMGVMALGTLMVASAAAPARADGWRHERWEHHHHWRPPVVVYGAPGYYYRPAPPVVYAPPVYYAPPPVYYAPRVYSPGVSVGIGFNLR